MKNLFLLAVLLVSYTSFGQTAEEYFELGTLEESKNNYEAAIKAFSNALKIDTEYTEAYYMRAKLLYDEDQYQDAIKDLDKAILLKPNPVEFYMELLKLRGNIHLKVKDKDKACKDFIEASKLGAYIDEDYLEICNYKRIKNEAIYLDLPDKTNWKIQEESIKDDQKIILLKNDKTAEYLSLISQSGVKNSNLTDLMNETFQIEKEQSKDAKFSLIEKDLNAKEPWIMYSIQNKSNEIHNRLETEVWFLIQGDNNLHICTISISDNSFTKMKKEEIINLFKTTKIVYN